MIERITECGPPISNADIQSLETRLSVRLPADYKTFLLKHNGGRPEPVDFPIHGFDNRSYDCIKLFFRIGGSVESSTLDWNYTIMEQLPPELFPIATTDCGDKICLVLSGTKAGQPGSVIFWDYHEAWGTEGYCYAIYPIADSFTDLVEAIQDMPD